MKTLGLNVNLGKHTFKMAIYLLLVFLFVAYSMSCYMQPVVEGGVFSKKKRKRSTRLAGGKKKEKTTGRIWARAREKIPSVRSNLDTIQEQYVKKDVLDEIKTRAIKLEQEFEATKLSGV